MPYVTAVLGIHAADTKAKVLDPSTYEPIIVAKYGFIVSIHGLVLAVMSTM
jgi:hypothetical protein